MGGSYKRQAGETRSCCEVVAECNKKMLQFLQFLFILWSAANGSDGDGEMGEKNLFEVFPHFTCFVSPSLQFTEEIKEKTAWYRT